MTDKERMDWLEENKPISTYFVDSTRKYVKLWLVQDVCFEASTLRGAVDKAAGGGSHD